jgi:hypothetical protein
MRAAQKVRGAKLEGIQFTAPFTYTTQQLWLKLYKQICKEEHRRKFWEKFHPSGTNL